MAIAVLVVKRLRFGIRLSINAYNINIIISTLSDFCMTTEEQLSSKLESIRDSIVGFRFATDALETRAHKIELELADCRNRVSELSSAGIRVGEQLHTINRSMDAMSTDIRAVRNSVLSAILAATLIWVAGTAFSTMQTQRQNAPAVAGSAT